MRLPSVFITHGGGPLPVLGHPSHTELTAALKALPARLHLPAPPRAVLLCSAHFEAEQPTLIAAPPERLLYDYGGFHPDAYALRYAPPGEPAVAEAAMQLLRNVGFKPRLEPSDRGLDHGAFIPLMLMYPDARVPVVELSILSSLSPEEHLRMGEALQPLRDQGVLVVGSGSSWHNLQMMFRHISGSALPDGKLVGQEFDDWLSDAVTAHTGAARNRRLSEWSCAPGGQEAHPREDHLMPLLVVAAAGGDSKGVADRMRMGGMQVSNFIFGAE